MKLEKTTSLEDCSICFITMAHRDSVGHGKHHFHRDCLKEWAKKADELKDAVMNPDVFPCPICRADLQKNSLLSWKERCAKELKAVKNDAHRGVTDISGIGMLLGCSAIIGTGGRIVEGSHKMDIPSIMTSIALIGSNFLTGGAIHVAAGLLKRHCRLINLSR